MNALPAEAPVLTEPLSVEATLAIDQTVADVMCALTQNDPHYGLCLHNQTQSKDGTPIHIYCELVSDANRVVHEENVITIMTSNQMHHVNAGDLWDQNQGLGAFPGPTRCKIPAGIPQEMFFRLVCLRLEAHIYALRCVNIQRINEPVKLTHMNAVGLIITPVGA